MTTVMREVVKALTGQRFPLEDEKRTQVLIEEALKEHHCGLFWRVDREVRLAKGVIDFVVSRKVGVEVKLKGNAGAIERQLRRYAEDEVLTGLVLVTAKPIGLPSLIRGKPLAIVDLAKAWL